MKFILNCCWVISGQTWKSRVFNQDSRYVSQYVQLSKIDKMYKNGNFCKTCFISLKHV